MRPAFLALAVIVVCGPALAGEASVAVAANFSEPAKAIAAAFKNKTGHDLSLSFGASGGFYTQIKQAAPFDVFLSADAERPRALAQEGFAVPESRFTYAVGKLALWSRAADAAPGEATLRAGRFHRLAIANPLAAPYGAAALEALASLGLAEAVRPKLVEGASIAQAFQFAETGNAEFAFVALAQTIGKGGATWIVSPSLHAPIRQDAVLLKRGENNDAAKALLDFLKSGEARAIVERYGYGLEAAG